MHQKFSHGDNAAASSLLGRSAPEFSSVTRLAAQRGVKSRQSAGPAEATGNFDRCPRRQRGGPLPDHDEGRAIAAVHYEAVDWP